MFRFCLATCSRKTPIRRRKPRAQIVCPNCWGLTEDRYDTTMLSCQHCAHRFNPQEGPAEGQHVRTSGGTRYRIKDLLPADGSPPSHRLYALMALREDGEKVYLPARPEDHALFAEAEARLQAEALPLPTLAVRSGQTPTRRAAITISTGAISSTRVSFFASGCCYARS